MLNVENLRLGFVRDGRMLVAVNGVSFTVGAGETFALLGESGCGKSVTAQGILRLLPASSRVLGGRVNFDDSELMGLPEGDMRAVRGGRIAMIFQEPATSLNPVLSVGEQLGEVLALHRDLQGEAAQVQMLALLNQVGIADPARRLKEYPFQMSGGMKQRVMIAMALAGEPDLLIADEPTTALDVTVQAQILDLLADLQRQRGMGILLITHDLGVVARMAHRVGVMYAGELVEVAEREAFFHRPRHPYTRALFAALPDHARHGETLRALPGQVPALNAMPAGCRFADRCPEVLPLCRSTSPEWRPLDVATMHHQVRCHGEGGASAPVTRNIDAQPSRVGENLLTVSGLQVHFPIRRGVLQRVVGAVKAVDGVNLQLAAGRTLALVGESGCGKTTVGKAILGLLPLAGGTVGLAPAQGKGLRQRMQMVFQDPFASLNPRMTVGEIIREGMEALAIAGDHAQRLATLMTQVGLDPQAIHRYPHEFSGGQRQRIAIARALAVQPELLICDEPTSALDVSVQAQILNLLKALQHELGVAYLFITHNFAVVKYLADDVAVMYLGRIVERGSAAQVLQHPSHPYTRALLSAVPVPRLDDSPAQVIRLPGETPSPSQPPSGCHFHPRCREAEARCKTHYPDLIELGNGHGVGCHLYSPR